MCVCFMFVCFEFKKPCCTMPAELPSWCRRKQLLGTSTPNVVLDAPHDIRRPTQAVITSVLVLPSEFGFGKTLDSTIIRSSM